jgi:polycomb protein EED
LEFCLSSPHMLASSSGDKSVRIWNIWGAGCAEPAEGELPSMNYGMGDAEEGTVIWAILAGAGRSGHTDKVPGLVGALLVHDAGNMS